MVYRVSKDTWMKNKGIMLETCGLIYVGTLQILHQLQPMQVSGLIIQPKSQKLFSNAS